MSIELQKISGINLKGLNQKLKLLSNSKKVTIDEHVSNDVSVGTSSSLSDSKSKRENKSVNEVIENLFENRFKSKIDALEDFKILK